MTSLHSAYVRVIVIFRADFLLPVHSLDRPWEGRTGLGTLIGLLRTSPSCNCVRQARKR